MTMLTIRLDPGEVFISTQPTQIHTVLGSCVSLILYHPRSKQGAISHGRKPTQECDHSIHGWKICKNLGDYVDCSMEFMLSYFAQKGIQPPELVIKLFGGALMSACTPGTTTDYSVMTMGKRNSDRAMELLQTKKLHLMTSDCGGQWTRQIIFNSHTGEVKLKRIHTTAQPINPLERMYRT